MFLYVDYILLAGPTEDLCRQGTDELLKELSQLGYRASAKKAQICQQQVTHLGYILREGKRWLTEARKHAITQILVPRTAQQV